MLISSKEKVYNFSASVSMALIIFIKQSAECTIPGSHFILDTNLSKVDGAGKGIFHTFLMHRKVFGLIHFNVKGICNVFFGPFTYFTFTINNTINLSFREIF